MRIAVNGAMGWISLAGLLSACAPSAPACRASAATERQIRTLDGLIADSTLAIGKGYRMAPGAGGSLNLCLGGASAHVGVGFCTDGQGPVPVAIDMTTEKRKLESLKAQRAALAQRQTQETTQCNGAT